MGAKDDLFLQQADFYQYMKEHDAELLNFNATEIEDEEADIEPDTDLEDTEKEGDDEIPKMETAKKAIEQKTMSVFYLSRDLRMFSLVLGIDITDASVAAISSSDINLELLDLSGWHSICYSSIAPS